jgi:hypothetical protein
MRMLYKLKACETKAVVSAVLNLETCNFTNNENTGHARFVLNNTSDKLLLECLNQITTVEASLNVGNNSIITNESRYLWKLNPNLKINKIRLKLIRILKPLGLLFTVRNIHTRRYLILSRVEFKTFKIKWISIYGDLPFNVLIKNNTYIILIDANFKDILISAIDKYIICDTPEREILKRNLIDETLTKLNYLVSLPS